MRIFALAATIMLSSLALAAPASAAGRIEARVGLDNISASQSDFDISADDSGVSYGVEAGYDIDNGGLLFGPYASFDATSIDGADYGLGLGLRAGTRVSPTVLVYGKGGYVLGKAEGEENGGYQIGAGLEFDLGPRLYVKGEAVYSDFGSVLAVNGFDINLERFQGLAAVGVRF